MLKIFLKLFLTKLVLVIIKIIFYALNNNFSYIQPSFFWNKDSYFDHDDTDAFFIQKKETTTYFVKYFSISPLSVTLFCTIKHMQKYTIDLTIIVSATIRIK